VDVQSTEREETLPSNAPEAALPKSKNESLPQAEPRANLVEQEVDARFSENADSESPEVPKEQVKDLDSLAPPAVIKNEQASSMASEPASPEAPKSPRRRGQFNTGTLSILDEHERQNQVQDVFIPQSNSPFSLTQAQETVLAFSQTLNAQGKMVAAQMMSKVEILQASPTALVFCIPHAGLQTTFVEISADLLQHLRQHLHNDFIELSSEIKTSEQTSKPYTAEEKFNAMAETNPSLLDLKNTFNFEIKP
jgi:DNA polymerase-3 subunit gamma/tau